MLTRVCYLYRDASNYKFWGHFVLEGAITRDEVAAYMIDREWFVPEAIGLEPLQPDDWTDEDHDFHELHQFEPVAEGEPICTAAEFVERMKLAERLEWFVV